MIKIEKVSSTNWNVIGYDSDNEEWNNLAAFRTKKEALAFVRQNQLAFDITNILKGK